MLVEGQTEEAIVREVIAPYLEGPSTWVSYSILATSRRPSGSKVRGGVSSWSKIDSDIRKLLGDSSIDILTTLLDFYGLPADAPGMATRPRSGPRDRVAHVERLIGAEIASDRFRVHLTLHETEAWVLAASDLLGQHLGDPAIGERIARLAAAAGGPELVDDGPSTAPSKQLEKLCPSYDKIVDGLAVLRRAGLQTVLEQCPHAAAWVESLRAPVEGHA